MNDESRPSAPLKEEGLEIAVTLKVVQGQIYPNPRVSEINHHSKSKQHTPHHGDDDDDDDTNGKRLAFTAGTQSSQTDLSSLLDGSSSGFFNPA